MALIELVTEQFGYDEDDNPWRLISRDNPQRWEQIDTEDDLVTPVKTTWVT